MYSGIYLKICVSPELKTDNFLTSILLDLKTKVRQIEVPKSAPRANLMSVRDAQRMDETNKALNTKITDS